MGRAVNRVWIECGEAPSIIIDGMLRIEFNQKDVVKARHLLEKLVVFLAEELGTTECRIDKLDR